MSQQSSTVPAKNQKNQRSLYDLHAPKLWGLILRAHLSPPQSEAVLIKAFVTVLKQVDEKDMTERDFFAALIQSALHEGLPLTCLQAIFSEQRRG